MFVGLGLSTHRVRPSPWDKDCMEMELVMDHVTDRSLECQTRQIESELWMVRLA